MNSRLESFSQEVVTTIRRRTCIAESLWHGSGFPVRFDRTDAATDLSRQRKQEANLNEVPFAETAAEGKLHNTRRMDCSIPR